MRPRLVERLNEGFSSGRKLTLISAPAGFGKTTLVSEWAAGCGQPVAWLSLDEGDNDPISFLAYFVTALQTIAAKIGNEVLAILQSPQPSPIESILTALLNEITTVQDHFVLVLDDYHVIDSKPIDEALSFLLDHLPPRMHLLITTREDPRLPLHRLRARGQLTEIRAADLRFSHEEVGTFLNRMMGLNLSSVNVSALEIRTEGWIAGLQLAALSIQGRKDIDRFIEVFTGSHRFVLDYLVEEVLHQQPEAIHEFLLQTSILDKLCIPLCDAVTTREDSKEMLESLERNNLFLIPLDDQRQWFRYHHLFADVLQTYLKEAQPGADTKLQLRASEWYEHNSMLSDAIRYALAAKEFERTAGLLELAWPETEYGSIQSPLWVSWVKTLPLEIFHTRPVLNVDYAIALLSIGEIEAAERRLKDTEEQLKPESGSLGMIVADMKQFHSLPETIAIGRAYTAQAQGDIQATIHYSRQVLELVPEEDAYRRAQANMMLGMTYWATGDLEAAERIFADHTLRLRMTGNIPDAISTTVVLADMRMALGQLQLAIDSTKELIQFILDQDGSMISDAADLHRELADLCLEQWDLEAVVQHLQKSKELGEKTKHPVWRYRWCFLQARFNSTIHDLDSALALLDEAEKLYIRTPLPDLTPISAMKARIWISQGKLSKAMTWVNEQNLTVDDELSYLREFDHITLARILFARFQDDHDEETLLAAMRLLTRLLQMAEGGKRNGKVIEILALQALAYQLQGNAASALDVLERALTLAEPEGYIRTFVDAGKPLAELIARLKPIGRALHSQEFRLKLLSAFDQNSTENAISKTSTRMDKLQSSSLHLVEPLSDRELEVLRLLRSDLNGPEIARECMVSLTTIRTHTQNIYAKLGVNNRRAAVRRAEELNLF
jgi:LuxR family transcriptional regulator, maltose regulon positive regulatory protein